MENEKCRKPILFSGRILLNHDKYFNKNCVYLGSKNWKSERDFSETPKNKCYIKYWHSAEYK